MVPLAGTQATGCLLERGSSECPRGVGLWLKGQAPARVACRLYLSLGHCSDDGFLFPSEGLPDAVRERWETFCTSSLGETNKRNTVDLVGFTRLRFYDFRALSLCPFVQEGVRELPFAPVVVGQGEVCLFTRKRGQCAVFWLICLDNCSFRPGMAKGHREATDTYFAPHLVCCPQRPAPQRFSRQNSL